MSSAHENRCLCICSAYQHHNVKNRVPHVASSPDNPYLRLLELRTPIRIASAASPENQYLCRGPSTAQEPHSVRRRSQPLRELQCCAGVRATRTPLPPGTCTRG